MKKLIIVLMVVAVASFLFVGCLPETVTPVTPTEPTEPTAAKTETPFIVSVGGITSASTSTLTDSAEVDGVGVAGAIIKVYIDGVQSGVGSTGTEGTFSDIEVTMIDLEDGERKVYVTATVPGLAESDKSTEITFDYDTTAPKIASAIADSSANSITVTFSEDVLTSLSGSTFDDSALNVANWFVDSSVLTAADVLSKVSSSVIRITPSTPVGVAGDIIYVEVYDVMDIAGNDISATIPEVWSGLSVP